MKLNPLPSLKVERPRRLLSMTEVEQRVARSRWWIRQQINEGKFPKPVDLGTRRVAFVETEIDAHIDGLIAKRDVADAKA